MTSSNWSREEGEVEGSLVGQDMASGEGRRRHHDLVPLAALLKREMKSEKMEKPTVRFGHAAQSKKGEDYFLIKTDCQRVSGNPSSSFSVFAVLFNFSDSDYILLCMFQWNFRFTFYSWGVTTALLD